MIAFIDADEFLVPTIDQSLDKIVCNLFSKFNDIAATRLSKYDSREIGGIGVNWKIYGTNHHVAKPQGFIIENYLLRGETEANRHIKSIVNPRAVVSWINPHFANYFSDYRSVSQTGLYLSGPFCYTENASPIRINHYFYKSVEEFKFRLKRKKCDIVISEEELAASIEQSLNEAELYNQIEDAIACRYVDQVKQELAQNGYKL